MFLLHLLVHLFMSAKTGHGQAPSSVLMTEGSEGLNPLALGRGPSRRGQKEDTEMFSLQSSINVLSHFHSLSVHALSLLLTLWARQHLHFPSFLQVSYNSNSSACHHLQNWLQKEITEASCKWLFLRRGFPSAQSLKEWTWNKNRAIEESIILLKKEKRWRKYNHH